MRQAMERAGGHYMGGQHDTWKDWPGTRCKMWGTVRNPWRWYLSHYLWNNAKRSTIDGFRGWLPVALRGRACSLYHRRTYGDACERFVATDRLSEALSTLWGIDAPEPVNTSAERTGMLIVPCEWYTDDLVDLVSRREVRFIERWGFEPFTPTDWVSTPTPTSEGSSS